MIYGMRKPRFLRIVAFLFPLLLPAALPAQDLASGDTAVQPARELFMSGKVEDSISLLRTALEDAGASNRDLLSYWLVRAHLVRNQVPEAEAEARRQFGETGGSGISLAAMGDLEYRLGHFESASRYYRQAANAGPGFARTWLGLGRVLESERMLKSASSCYKKAYSLDPDDPDIMQARAVALPRSPEQRELWRKYTETALYEDPVDIENTRVWLEREEKWADIDLRNLREVPEHTHLKLLHFYIPNRGYNRYGVEIKINGKKKARMLLDTGASGILLNRKKAKSAGVKAAGNIKIGGIGDEGERGSEVGLAETVEIGSLVFENYPVSFSSKYGSDAEDGIIGTNVFSLFLITLDFPRKTMLLDRLPKPPDIGKDESYRWWNYNWQPGPERRGYYPFREIGTKIIIPTIVNDTQEALFVLDTGAAINLLSLQLAEKVNYTRSTESRIVGLSGAVANTRKANQIDLTLAGVQQTSYNTFSIDMASMSQDMGTEIGGFVGYPLLQHVTLLIDYRTATLRMIPEPSRLSK